MTLGVMHADEISSPWITAMLFDLVDEVRHQNHDLDPETTFVCLRRYKRKKKELFLEGIYQELKIV